MVVDQDSIADMVYVVYDLDGPVETFVDEDEAYAFADHDEEVVTYQNARDT